MKKDFVMPIAVLTLVCLFVTGALAIGHNVTQPLIAAAAAERARMAMTMIIPHAEGFEPVEISGLPATVQAVYRTTNNVGYVFILGTMGFGGEIRTICGIDPDGSLIRTAILSHTETPGFFESVFAESHASQYWGRGSYGIDGVAIVSGSTRTATAFKSALHYAFDAFEMVRSGGTR